MSTGLGTQLPACGAGVSQGDLPAVTAAEQAAAGGSGSEGRALRGALGTQLGAEARGKRCCGGSPRASPPLPLAVRKTGCVDKAGAVRGSSWKRWRRGGQGSFSSLPMLGKCIERTFLPQIKKLSVKSEAASLVTALMSSPNPLLPTEHLQHGPKTSLMSPGCRGHAGRSGN